MWSRIKAEPSLVTGVVVAALMVAGSFGVHFTDAQQQALVAGVAAVLALLGAGVTRSKVTPASKSKGQPGVGALHPMAVDDHTEPAPNADDPETVENPDVPIEESN